MTHLQLFTPSLARRASNPQAWRTGFWCRFPWAAVLGLLATAIASGFMVRILLSSDNRAVDSWTYQPTVLLAITYTIANICLQFALGQAVTISWWLRALRGDATARELHSTWAFGNGFKDILLSGRSFNLVALAGFMVTLAPVNGPLLQRASIVRSRGGYDLVNVTIPIAPKMGSGYTGFVTGRGSQPNALTSEFRSIINRHTSRKAINVTASGCNGVCKGKLLGAGYDIQCNDAFQPYYIDPWYEDGSSRVASLECFRTYFHYSEEYGMPSVINFGTAFKPGNDCVGNLTLRKCTMTPATIEYPIVLRNDTISLDPDGSWMSDRAITRWPDAIENHGTGSHASTHGGFWLYLSSVYNSVAITNHTGRHYWEVASLGTTALGYVVDDGAPGGCNLTYRDPTFDIMGDAREIAFRTALYLETDENRRNATNRQTIEVQQLWSQIVYQSQYTYLAIAVAVTILAALCVFTILLGWWNLGRNVTLSPIEIAKAFAAPTLQDAKSNADIDTLLKTMGLRRFRYGAVWDVVEVDGDSEASLRFARTGQCERPREGQNFL